MPRYHERFYRSFSHELFKMVVTRVIKSLQMILSTTRCKGISSAFHENHIARLRSARNSLVIHSCELSIASGARVPPLLRDFSPSCARGFRMDRCIMGRVFFSVSQKARTTTSAKIL